MTTCVSKHKSLLRMAFAFALIALPLAAGRAGEGEGRIVFETETLENGLRVVYAPLPNSTAAHIRVLYHVGSKDESPERRGFAHLFEHMMFRGSTHVAPEEHMRLIDGVGGWSNAFTSFDQTVYVNTVPASQCELALWLEADRMAGFRVSPAIFATERNVVEEEWRMRLNAPYGEVLDILCDSLYSKHHYKWSPIGDMEQLRAADAGELAEFFNRYYVPNNAVLVIAGGMDVDAAKAAVRRYFAWIPRGAAIQRVSPAEPEPTAPRRREAALAVPLAMIVRMFPLPPRDHADMDALAVASSLLGGGRASRLDKALVTGAAPLCASAGSLMLDLEDGGGLGVTGVLLPGADAARVEEILKAELARLAAEPAPDDELAKVKMSLRLGLINRQRTAESVAGAVGEEMLFSGKPDRVNSELARLEAVTAADVMRVAARYFTDIRSVTLLITPDPAATPPTLAAAPAPVDDPEAEKRIGPEKTFPDDFPTRPPEMAVLPTARFDRGVEAAVEGARVVTLTDRRLPTVNVWLVLRGGGHTEPAGKEGLADLAAEWLRRGPTGWTPDVFNETLEAAGASLSVADGGDHTMISARFLSDPASRDAALVGLCAMLSAPAFDEDEFAKIRNQARAGQVVSWSDPDTVAAHALNRRLFGDSPFGRAATPVTLDAITPSDARAYHAAHYRRDGALLIVAGDAAAEDARAWAAKILVAVAEGAAPKADYTLPPVPEERAVELVDHPAATQAAVRMGTRAYTLASDEKYAGSMAGVLLSQGIHSRLGRYVRAEKGLAYGVTGMFFPGRQAGSFITDLGTKPATAREAIDACFTVIETLRQTPPDEAEMDDVRRRVSGSLLLGMQTVEQQGRQRLTGMLNGYPDDYYDRYAERIAATPAAAIRDVMNRYADPARTAVVVVAPAATVREGLAALGQVTESPMPTFPEPEAETGGLLDAILSRLAGDAEDGEAADTNEDGKTPTQGAADAPAPATETAEPVRQP